jgi:hypothetical protein
VARANVRPQNIDEGHNTGRDAPTRSRSAPAICGPIPAARRCRQRSAGYRTLVLHDCWTVSHRQICPTWPHGYSLRLVHRGIRPGPARWPTRCRPGNGIGRKRTRARLLDANAALILAGAVSVLAIPVALGASAKEGASARETSAAAPVKSSTSKSVAHLLGIPTIKSNMLASLALLATTDIIVAFLPLLGEENGAVGVRQSRAGGGGPLGHRRVLPGTGTGTGTADHDDTHHPGGSSGRARSRTGAETAGQPARTSRPAGRCRIACRTNRTRRRSVDVLSSVVCRVDKVAEEAPSLALEPPIRPGYAAYVGRSSAPAFLLIQRTRQAVSRSPAPRQPPAHTTPRPGGRPGSGRPAARPRS